MMKMDADYHFMTIGEGKRVHIACVVRGSTKYAHALCTISGKFGLRFDPKEEDICKSCLRVGVERMRGKA